MNMVNKINKEMMDREVKRLVNEVIGKDAIQKMASQLVDREPASLQGEQHLFAIGRVSGRKEQTNSFVGDRGV